MPGVETWIDQRFDELRKSGEKALNDLCAEIGRCRGHFVEGRPGAKIVEFAKENGTDLIIIGTHGHTGWDRLVLGSVAEHVIRHVDGAVLTVKPEDRK